MSHRFLLILALAACAPPGAETAPAAPAEEAIALDAEKLLRDVRILSADSMEGRRVGTPGSARARAYLLSEFERIGLEPVGGAYAHPFPVVRRGGADTVQGVNLLGKVTGTVRPDRYIVVTAHYDHLGVMRGEIFNGADDNASGVAGLLALAEHFRENPPESSILFAALDAEEGGLRGARALVEAPPVPREAMVLNVNLDMVGHSEAGELYAAGTSHHPFLKPYLDTVAARAPVRLLLGHDRPEPTPRDDWTTQSDHAAFHRAGIPFVYFGVEDHPDYHRPTDDFETLTPAFFVGAVETIADAVRVFDRGLPQIERAREG